MDVPLSRRFPAGGPADPEYMIGRRTVVEDLLTQLRAGRHLLVAGERRIGKTTVCQAVCARLHDEGFAVVRIDVPESGDGTALCRQILRAYLASGEGLARRARAAATKTLERVLEERGIPVDLSIVEAGALPRMRREILALPLRLATEQRRVVFWLDELQRVADYQDGSAVLHDLCDLYAGQDAAVVLTDGSNERTFDALLGDSDGLGKLVRRHDLAPVIPTGEWRLGLTDSFRLARHPIDPDALERLIAFGAGQPYPTMVTAQEAALTAERLGDGGVTAFEVDDAIAAARQRLLDDGH